MNVYTNNKAISGEIEETVYMSFNGSIKWQHILSQL